MTVKYRDACCVSNDGCDAPAGFGGAYGHYACDYSRGGGARYICFSCGLAVCDNCSKVVDWYNYGKRIICDICAEEDKR